MFKDILLAGAGGFAGSALRYALSATLLSAAIKSGFPLGTAVVNVSGCLLIGIFWVIVPHGSWQTLAIAGFCGGFTTFSAFSLETLKMLRGGEVGTAALYVVGSIAVCALCVWAGAVLTEKLTGMTAS